MVTNAVAPIQESTSPVITEDGTFLLDFLNCCSAYVIDGRLDRVTVPIDPLMAGQELQPDQSFC